jgi:hypothetical protein
VPKVRSSRLLFDVAAQRRPFLLLHLSLSLFLSSLSVASRISSRAFRPEVISYLYAGAKNSSGKSDEASSFRFRVTNHLSRGTRFRSTPKGEIGATVKTRRAAATEELCYVSVKFMPTNTMLSNAEAI